MFPRQLYLTAIVAVFLGAAAPSAEADIIEGAGPFVNGLAGEALGILEEDSLEKVERDARFRAVLRKGFALEAIGRFCLKQYWRKATPAERDEYLTLFEELIIQTYSARLDAIYNGETIQIVDVYPDGDNGARVATKIVADGGTDAIRIDWRVRQPNGDYKIVDVLIEGISMALTQRDEFVSIIQRNNGKLRNLLDDLRDKVKKLKSEPAA